MITTPGAIPTILFAYLLRIEVTGAWTGSDYMTLVTTTGL
jgi:hypothetical protein